MLISSAKSRNVTGAAHQPASMISCLAISHTCLPSLPSGKTLLFWSDLGAILVGKVHEHSEVGR